MSLNMDKVFVFLKDSKKSNDHNLDELLNSSNNLNLIRLIAASLVTFHHSFPLTGRQGDFLERTTGFLSFGSLSVWVFFFISGLLVSRSFDNGQPFTYIVARVLRIYPALIVACIFTALFVGSLSTKLALKDYLSNIAVYDYIVQNLRFNTAYELPGVFENNSYPRSVNGTLWTLRYEVYMYFLVFVIGLLGWLRQQHTFNLLIVMMVLLYLKQPTGMFLISGEWNREIIFSIFVFALGAMAYVNRHLIQLSLVRLVGLCVLLIMLKESVFVYFIFLLVVMDAVLFLSFHPKLQSDKLLINNDYSYGIYIYSFPIQQMVAMHFSKLTPFEHFFTAYLIALIFAIASWHLIEKPTLRLKSWVSDLIRSSLSTSMMTIKND